MNPKLFLFLGSFFAFLSVALGAFGAHALKDKLDAYFLSIFRTGVEYQFFHSLALLLVGILIQHRLQAGSIIGGYRWAGILFIVGTIVFSGSLYLLALTQVKTWGAVTPLGGVCFLAGWLVLCVETLRS
jgi:uncharacterized membrane protein YgdD (TMEM256/DUF423 family)